MAITPFPLSARSRSLFPRLGPGAGPIIRQFPSLGGHLALTAPRRSGVGSPTSPVRQGAHVSSDDASSDPAIDALLDRAIDAALDSLNRLEAQAREVARWFRTSAGAEARDGLRELIAGAERIVHLASAAVDASGTDLTTFCESRGLAAETATASLMHELVRHQRAADGAALAATLERRFLAALEHWRQLFFALGDAPTGPSGSAA